MLLNIKNYHIFHHFCSYGSAFGRTVTFCTYILACPVQLYKERILKNCHHFCYIL